MALIVEDGTGLSTSEAYISVADASTYFTARGNTTWAAISTDDLREAYLRQATEYMTQVYRSRWEGVRYSETQALDADLTRGVIRETVGPIAVEYDKYSPERVRYSAIDAMLQPYLKSGGTNSVGLVRC